ncbi:MAG: hypothetical protein II458_06495 [Oscillospiraceae bacterium]|nr:hypothetical protein [Oscillospiraceae bacterium]
MYNRYIRDDYGRYERVPQYDTPPVPPSSPPTPHPVPDNPASPPPFSVPPPKPELPDLKFFDRLLDKLHLGDLDSGDLLLLLILFLLFRQEADEEVLIALGLLLIL